jgi:hypothetical protein
MFYIVRQKEKKNNRFLSPASLEAAELTEKAQYSKDNNKVLPYLLFWVVSANSAGSVRDKGFISRPLR